jgi:hypothetical protein
MAATRFATSSHHTGTDKRSTSVRIAASKQTGSSTTRAARTREMDDTSESATTAQIWKLDLDEP